MEHEIQITIVWQDKEGTMHDRVISEIDEAIELLENIQNEFDEAESE